MTSTGDVLVCDSADNPFEYQRHIASQSAGHDQYETAKSTCLWLVRAAQLAKQVSLWRITYTAQAFLIGWELVLQRYPTVAN